jgi:ABC transporter family protein
MFRFRGWRTLTHAHNHLGRGDALSTLGDFTTTRRVVLLSSLALGIGVFSAFVALALLRLIGLFTNLFFFQRWDTTLVSPAGHTLGLFVVLVPIVGALIIGLLARYGSERIRGHGIPSPASRYDHYVHEFSGGMRQRVMLAMALSCNPTLLIADGPTTALDVTIQATILDLIRSMIERLHMSLLKVRSFLGWL